MILAGLSDNGIFFDARDSVVHLCGQSGHVRLVVWRLRGTHPNPDSFRHVHTLVGDNGGTDTADYVLHLQRLNGPANARPIAYGQIVTGHWVPGGNGCLHLHRRVPAM